MNKSTLYASATFAGAVLGFFSARVILQGSWLNLIIWALAGLIVGVYTMGKKQTILAGALYGAFLVASFMVFGFEGKSEQIKSFSLLTLGLTGLGAVCGIALGFMGVWLRSRSTNNK